MRFAFFSEPEMDSSKRRCGVRTPSQRDTHARRRLLEAEPHDAVKGREATTPIAGVIQC
jgi:hypothetical protein